MNRTAWGLLLLLLLSMLPSGCGWHGQGDVSLRPLPYPYEAGVAVHDGGAPATLASRGIVFAHDGELVRTAGQDAACSLVDRARQFWEATVFLYRRREWRGSSFFGNHLIEPITSEGGPSFFGFKLYVGSIAALPDGMPDEVAAQVAEAVAYELRAKGGLMILGGPDGGVGGPAPAVMDHLRGESERGGVYLVDRDRLLEYSFVRRYLQWGAVVGDDAVTITIRSVDDGLGHRWVPTLKELDGITFYTPDPVNTRVLLAGSAVGELTVNPADRLRRGSVTIVGAGEAQPRSATGR